MNLKTTATTPGPYCSNGHRRTAKNSNWATVVVRGKPYLQIRCGICRAQSQRLRYASRKRECAEGGTTELNL